MTATFTLAYKLAWLPRMLAAGHRTMDAFPAAPIRHGAREKLAGAKRILFLGDLSAVANRRPPEFCQDFRRLCASADIIVANCESAIVSQLVRPFQTRLGLCHAMKAPFLAETLAAAAIAPEKTVMSLANNHMADHGRRGLVETVETLRAMGITPVGLTSKTPPWELVDIGGTKIAVLAFTEWIDRDAGLFRDMIRCGATGERAPEADLVCALPHWGNEFRFRPDAGMRRAACKLAALGADVIAGTHPHVTQPVEKIGTALAAYSLGDFLGSALAYTPWRLRLSMALAMDFMPGLPPLNRVTGYEAHIFFRRPLGGRERIEAIKALPEPERMRVQSFAKRVLGLPPSRQAASAVGAPAQAS